MSLYRYQTRILNSGECTPSAAKVQEETAKQAQTNWYFFCFAPIFYHILVNRAEKRFLKSDSRLPHTPCGEPGPLFHSPFCLWPQEALGVIGL